MFLKLNKAFLKVFAAISLLVWTVAMHHDAWLSLAGLDHHHDHHHSSDPHHGHSHGEHSHHDHHDSIPLPDTHSDPVTPGIAKVGISGPKLLADTYFWMAFVSTPLLIETQSSGPKHPPPKAAPDLDPPALVLLAHSVQSNAPPARS